MAKFAIDSGHGVYPDTGAEGYLIEQNVAIDIGLKVIDKLRALGHTAWNVRPSSARSITDSLQKRIDAAKGADYLISIHLNAGGGEGTEVYAASKAGYQLAEKVLSQIVSLGFTNRGVKDGSRLYVIRNSVEVAILIEVCFVDSVRDSKLYNALGSDEIASAIVKGLTGQSSSTTVLNNKIENVLGINNDMKEIQYYINKMRIGDANGNTLIEDGIKGQRTTEAVKNFQQIVGIEVDGIAGKETWNCIQQIFAKPLCGISYVQRIPTRYIQWRVGVTIDGIFGRNTAEAVKNFQARNKLYTDGIVGENTWRALIG